MSYDLPKLRNWLLEDGGKFVGVNAHPTTIHMRQNHTTLTAELRFAASEARLVIKKVPNSPRKESGFNICQIHERISRQSEILSLSTPEFYDYHQSTGCIAMEFVPGITLLDLLKLELSGRRPRGYDCDHLIKRAAAVLAEFHRLTPAGVGVAEATHSNTSYVEGFQRLLNDPLINRALRSVAHPLSRASEEGGSTFLCRTDSRLLVHDSQPKNILVPEPNRVCFIDLSFNAGPPAVNLALFVTMFDRLIIRYYSAHAKKTIGHWKQTFVKHYLRHTDFADTANDFRFFYLWALVRTMRYHISHRKWFRAYLSRCYLQQIRSVLENDQLNLLTLETTS